MFRILYCLQTILSEGMTIVVTFLVFHLQIHAFMLHCHLLYFTWKVVDTEKNPLFQNPF